METRVKKIVKPDPKSGWPEWYYKVQVKELTFSAFSFNKIPRWSTVQTYRTRLEAEECAAKWELVKEEEYEQTSSS